MIGRVALRDDLMTGETLKRAIDEVSVTAGCTERVPSFQSEGGTLHKYPCCGAQRKRDLKQDDQSEPLLEFIIILHSFMGDISYFQPNGKLIFISVSQGKLNPCAHQGANSSHARREALAAPADLPALMGGILAFLAQSGGGLDVSQSKQQYLLAPLPHSPRS